MEDLEAGPFSICSGVWNDKNNTYKRLSAVEKNKCCLETCDPVLTECHKLCPKNKNCKKTCKDINDSCIDYCQLSTTGIWGRKNPIFKATKTFGCGDGVYYPINQQCVKDNKNNIINFCEKDCTPSDDYNCSDICNYVYNDIINPSNTHLYFTGKNKDKKIEIDGKIKNSRQSPNNTIKYFFYGILLSIFFVILFIIIKKRK
jgi:hypothetical protein